MFGAGVAVPDRGAGLEVVGGVAGRRVAAVHAQRDPAHARQDERLAVRPDPVDMPVAQRWPDLAGQDLVTSRSALVVTFTGRPRAVASGKPTQARVRNDASNALMVSCTSAP